MSDIDPTIFRSYDIRGLVETQLTESTVERLGRAYGTFALGKGAKKVSIAHDCRDSSPRIRDTLIKGITATGVDVIDVGCVPTPMQYFSLHHLDVDGGIMITGSHNPPEYNGFKLSVGTGSIHGDTIQELRRLAESDGLVSGASTGSVETVDIVGPYTDFLTNNLKLGDRKLKVVVDGGNGTAGPFAVPIFEALGVDVVPLFIDMDPTFAPAHAALAYVNYAEVIFGYADDPGTNIQKGLRGANEALALDGKDPAAHCYLGRICAQVGESESAMAEFDAALALNPSFAMAHYGRGLALTFSGDSEAALEALQTAMRLSPHDPQMWLFEMISGYAEMQRLNHEESLAWAEKAVRHPAAGFYAHAGRAIALAFLGRDSEAAAAKEKTLALKPDMSFAFVRKTWPHWNEVGMKVLAEGMAKAGFTEPE